jgi:hypothetical protein
MFEQVGHGRGEDGHDQRGGHDSPVEDRASCWDRGSNYSDGLPPSLLGERRTKLPMICRLFCLADPGPRRPRFSCKSVCIEFQAMAASTLRWRCCPASTHDLPAYAQRASVGARPRHTSRQRFRCPPHPGNETSPQESNKISPHSTRDLEAHQPRSCRTWPRRRGPWCCAPRCQAQQWRPDVEQPNLEISITCFRSSPALEWRDGAS